MGETAGKDPATFPNTTVHNLNINEDRDAVMEEHWTAAGNPCGAVSECS